MKRIHLLKPGTFVGKDKKSYTFTADDVRSVAESYNPQLSEAPIVIGHPEEDSPAWGKIATASCDADANLFVTPHRVHPQFAEAVGDGRFDKVTASLYSPDHPANPAPGKWYLQHVGFLGAKAPAVKGLQPIQFADGGAPAVIVSLSEGDDEAVTLLTRLADLFRTGRKPQLSEAAAAIVAAADPSLVQTEADMAEKTAAIQLAEAQTLITQLQQQNTDLQKSQKADADKARRAELAQFVEGAVKDGKLLPAEKGMVIELASRIEAGTTVQLSEGAEKTDLLGAFKLFVTALPKRGPTTGEHASREKDVTITTGAAQFAAPAGTTVDAVQLEIHNKALAHQASHPNVSYEQAVQAVAAAG